MCWLYCEGKVQQKMVSMVTMVNSWDKLELKTDLWLCKCQFNLLKLVRPCVTIVVLLVCRRGCASRQTVLLSSLPSHPTMDCRHCTRKMKLWPEQVKVQQGLCAYCLQYIYCVSCTLLICLQTTCLPVVWPVTGFHTSNTSSSWNLEYDQTNTAQP